MNVTEMKPLEQPCGTNNGRQLPPSLRTQPADLNAPAISLPVKGDSATLELLALMIGLDASDDAAVYLHRANTHHDGE